MRVILHTRYILGLIAIMLCGLFVVGSVSASDMDFPYIARVTGENVNVRSGPGTNHYRCEQLDHGTEVTVVSTSQGWAQIAPVEGTFSWIASSYVRRDPERENIGVVTGDRVRVYAGSDFIRPIYSTSVQVHLNSGDEVELLGQETGNYYKIVPPEGAYFWMSDMYLEPVRPVGQPEEPEPVEEPQPEPEPEDMDEADESPAEPEGEDEVEEPSAEQEEADKDEPSALDKYRAIEERIRAEREKDFLEQDYSEIKEELGQLVTDERDTVSRYAEFALAHIERIESAIEASRQLNRESSHLERTLANIESARQRRLEQIRDMGRYAVTGYLQRSFVFQDQADGTYYRILDERGRLLCYAVARDGVDTERAEQLIGRHVGLVGQIVPNPQTGAAIIRFTDIEEL